MKNIFKQGLLLILFLSFGSFSWAQAPENYYKAAYNKAGYPLKTALSKLIANHTVISYDGLWNAFKETDATADGKIWDIYSNCGYSFGEKCGNYKNECDCYNREHSFPKSWFDEGKPMYSDLYHLYPTDGKVNGMRSNYPYGEVSSSSYTSQNGSKLGSCSFPGYMGTVFEPIDEYKGDLARSYFYMVTCYESKVSTWDTPMLNGTSEQAFSNWAKELLLKWHRQDPVSPKEINRNNAIYSYQKNRNPFIDHPILAEKIWGNDPTPWSGEDPEDPEDSTFWASFTVLDIANLPIAGATLLCNQKSWVTDVAGRSSMELPLHQNLSYDISHVMYETLVGQFSATKDTSIKVQMKKKGGVGAETIDLKKNLKAYTQRGTLYLKGDGMVDAITVYSPRGILVDSKKGKIEISSWSYVPSQSGLYLIQVQKGEKTETLKIILRSHVNLF